jgi:type II secretory pathway predicted ATPase ExeA
MDNLQQYFGFQTEPFSTHIKIENIFPLPGLTALVQRFLFAVKSSAIMVITGDVGSGKSTSLRYAASTLHPAAFTVVPVIAHTGTYLEMLRQIAFTLQIECKASSLTRLISLLRKYIGDISSRKEKLVLIIDEAHLMRLECFAQLHTLNQFDYDSAPAMPIIFSGQINLLDKLMYHTSRSLASRILGRSHLDSLSVQDMRSYLKHHIEIAGVKDNLFADEAALAIHQGSGGLLRRANNLARGALLAAATEKCPVVSAEHVRIAATELV